MTRAMAPYATIALISILASCKTSQPCLTPQGDADQKPIVEAATKAFHEALLANDVDTYMSYISEDVALMPPGEPAIKGKSALRGWYQAFLSKFHTVSVSVDHREVWVDGGLAVEMGTYEWVLAPVAGGAPVVDRGNYIETWQRQLDGEWRFTRELYNNPEPAVPPR